MKKSELSNLREKTSEELTGMARELREAMLKGRFSAVVEGKSLGIKYRSMRRQVARLETLLSQKKTSVSPVKQAATVKPSKSKKPTATKKPESAKKV